MLKGICYNASRQERRKCSLWHAKSPGVATSGAFLFRCGKVAYALGWLPPIYLRPAICRCSRRLHLPRQRVRKTKIYSWWHTPFLYLYRGGSVAHYTIVAEMPQEAISELKKQVEQLENSNELLQNAISAGIGSLRDEVRESTVQEVKKALQANIEAVQKATKALEKQSDTLTSVMKQKVRELEESKNSFFRYEGLKIYLFWGGMVCNIGTFLIVLYYLFVK